MLKKTLLVAALVAASAGAFAQTSTPAKKELVARILKIQQPGIETMARELAKQPAGELMANAVDYLQTQVPADKREAMAKGLQTDADKYLNDTYPIVRNRAVQLAPSTVGTLLEEKFSEDELKQVVAMMESPVYLKFQGLGGEMQRVLVNKLVPDLKPQMEPKLRALDEAFAKRLGVPAMSAPAAAAPKAPAKK